MNISDFFMMTFTPPKKVIFKENEFVDIGGYQPAIKKIGLDSQRRVGLFLKSYQKNESSNSPITMKHGVETGIVIEGNIELTVAGAKYTLCKGDGYQFCTLLPHRFYNESANECKLVFTHSTADVYDL